MKNAAEPRASLIEYLSNFRRHADEIAYVHRRGYRTERWSYGRVADTATNFAKELRARGIVKNDKVILWGDNCAEWVAAFLGCMLNGAVAIPLDKAGTGEFARRVAEQVDAKLAICARSSMGELTSVPAMELESLEKAVAARASEDFHPVNAIRSDIVQIVFTSGTTAEPKGVVISHGNILANLEPMEGEIAKYRKYERYFHPIRFLNLLPLSHVFGQFLGIFIPQLIAGTVHFSETLNPGEILRTIKQERISVLVAVPRLLESLRDKVIRDLQERGLQEWFERTYAAAEGKKITRRMFMFRRLHRMFGWKFWALLSGGATLDKKIEEFWNRCGFAVIQGYGLTESTSLISVNHPFRIGKGSIGKVLPGRDIKLDPSGEIMVRGSNIAAGYWQGKRLHAVAGEEGWFRTGDMGEFDAEGNLYFKGRKKNVIVTPAGLNVYPEDLEAMLRRQPEVRDCVVVGLEREGNAEPCAVLLLEDATDAAEIVQRANAELADFQRMRQWYAWPERDFPRTSTQKPRTSVITEKVRMHLGGAAGAGREGVEPGGLAELIERITRRPAGVLAPEANLEDDLNMSSIDRVELIAAIEDRFQIEVSDAALGEFRTVGDLEKVLKHPAATRNSNHDRHKYWLWPMRWPMTWVRPLVYYLLAWPATLLLGGAPRVMGRENLRGVHRPALVICNHVAYVDPGLVLWALPARLRRCAFAMQGEMLQEMREPPAAWNPMARVANQIAYWMMTGLFNVFPLPQRSGFRESFRFAGEAADHGYNVVVFPEGRRSETEEMLPFRAGIGMLANNLHLPVIPLRIRGLGALKATGRRGWAPFGAISIHIGKPVRFAPGSKPENVAAELEHIVRGLGERAHPS